MGHKGFKKMLNFVVPYYLDIFLKIIALKFISVFEIDYSEIQCLK